MEIKFTEGLFNGLAAVRDATRAMPKTKSGHGYKYTPLDEILDYIRTPLADGGLVLTQMCVTEQVSGLTGVETHIFSADGGDLCSVCYAPPAGEGGARMSAIQRAGSEITYLRRYAICAMLELASDEDTDGYTLAESADATPTAKPKREWKPAAPKEPAPLPPKPVEHPDDNLELPKGEERTAEAICDRLTKIDDKKLAKEGNASPAPEEPRATAKDKPADAKAVLWKWLDKQGRIDEADELDRMTRDELNGLWKEMKAYEEGE